MNTILFKTPMGIWLIRSSLTRFIPRKWFIIETARIGADTDTYCSIKWSI